MGMLVTFAGAETALILTLKVNIFHTDLKTVLVDIDRDHIAED